MRAQIQEVSARNPGAIYAAASGLAPMGRKWIGLGKTSFSERCRGWSPSPVRPRLGRARWVYLPSIITVRLFLPWESWPHCFVAHRPGADAAWM